MMRIIISGVLACTAFLGGPSFAEPALVEVNSFRLKIAAMEPDTSTEIYVTSDGRSAILSSYREGHSGSYEYQVNDRVYRSHNRPFPVHPVMTEKGGGYLIEYDYFTAADIVWNSAGRFGVPWLIGPPRLAFSCVAHPVEHCSGCLLYNAAYVRELLEEVFSPMDDTGPSRACMVVNGEVLCIDDDLYGLDRVVFAGKSGTYARLIRERDHSRVVVNEREAYRLNEAESVREIALSAGGMAVGIIYEERNEARPATYIRIGEKKLGPYWGAESLMLSEDGSGFCFAHTVGTEWYYNYNGVSSGPCLGMETMVLSANGRGFGCVYRDIRDRNEGKARFFARVNDRIFGPYPSIENLKISRDGAGFAFQYATVHYPDKIETVRTAGGECGGLARVIYVRINDTTFGPYRCVNTGRRALSDYVEDYKGFSVNGDLTEYAVAYMKEYQWYVKYRDRLFGPYYSCTVPSFGEDGTSSVFQASHGPGRAMLMYNGTNVLDLGGRRVDKVDIRIPGTLVAKVTDMQASRTGGASSFILAGNRTFGMYDRVDFSVRDREVHLAYLMDKRIHLARVEFRKKPLHEENFYLLP